MTALQSHYRKWITGFALACPLRWQALGVSHFHKRAEVEQSCESRPALAGSAMLETAPLTLLAAMGLVLALTTLHS